MRSVQMLPISFIVAVIAFGVFSIPMYAGEVTATGDVMPGTDTSLWDATTTVVLGVDSGAGYLYVLDGGTLTIGDAIMGFSPDGNGVAYVSRGDSSWTIGNELYVGFEGVGSLTVDGGALQSNTLTLAEEADAEGTLIINGGTLTAGATIIGNYGDGTLRTSNNAVLNLQDVKLANNDLSVGGAIIKDTLFFFASFTSVKGNANVAFSGEGCTATGTSEMIFSELSGSTTSATVTDGAALNVNSLQIGGLGEAAFRIDNRSTLGVTGAASINGDSFMEAFVRAAEPGVSVGGNLTNNGRIGFNVGDLDAGTYTAMSVTGTYGGGGTVEVYGGTWNSSTYDVVVAEAVKVVVGQKAEFDLSVNQRVEIGDNCLVNFQGTTTSTSVGLTGASLSETLRQTLLAKLTEEEETILGGMTFELDMPVSGNRSVGFDVETADTDSVKFWKCLEGVWTEIDFMWWHSEKSLDGMMPIATTDSFSSYAVTGVAVLEPGTLGLLALGGCAILRRKRKKNL